VFSRCSRRPYFSPHLRLLLILATQLYFAVPVLILEASAQALPSQSAPVAKHGTPTGASLSDVSLSEFPEPSDSNKKLILLRKNVSSFRSFLLAPIASWIEADLFRVRLFKRLGFDWKYPSVEGSSTSEKPLAPAYKILQQMNESMSSAKNLALEAQMSWVGTQRVERQARVFIFRSSSEEIKKHYYPEFAQNISSFEFMRFLEPAAIAGYTTSVAITEGDTAVDRVHHYSPVIDASRELISSNRGDAIVGGLLSPDDLFVFSQAIQKIKAKVVAEKTLFLPFSSLKKESFSKGPIISSATEIIDESKLPQVASYQGAQKLPDGSFSSVMFNYDVFAFAQHAPWLPLTMTMVPRKVWILEVFLKDPFYPSGKQVIVIDKESKLPFYKIIHDKYGEVQKTVFGAWGYISEDDAEKGGLKVNVYPSFIFSVDRGARRASTLRMLRVQKYSDKQAKTSEILSRGFLDIGISKPSDKQSKKKESK